MYLPPWEQLEPASASSFEAELAREAPVGHILKNKAVKALARRVDRDDVLFEMAGGPRCAVVHLTYSVESDPAWPHTEMYESIDDFLRQRLDDD